MLAAAAFAGCASIPRDVDFAAVREMVDERIPQQVHWYQGGAEDEAIAKALEELLAEPLTAQAAVQVALLNNRRLQAKYEELGIAQADLVQAGLLSNPVLFASARFPHGGGRVNTEFDLAKDFLDILLLPARRRLAAAEFERAKLRVANAALDLAAEVMIAFYRVQGGVRLVEMLGIVDDSAQASYALARRYEAAGNLSERQLAQERSAAAETRADLVRARADLQAARDELNRLLGLTGPALDWTLGEPLPGLPATDPDPDAAESIALERRLDLAETRREIAQLADALAIVRSYRFVGGATVGVNSERDTDGTRVTGPNFSVELPIFDQRQAEIARLESLIRQSESRAAALEAEIRSAVRAAFHRVSIARGLVEHYRDEVVPAGEQVVKFTQQEQNYMLVDVFELLFAQRQVRAAYRGYIEAVRDYWIARADLVRATIGGSLPEVEVPPAPQPAPVEPEPTQDMKPMEHDQNSQDMSHDMQHSAPARHPHVSPTCRRDGADGGRDDGDVHRPSEGRRGSACRSRLLLPVAQLGAASRHLLARPVNHAGFRSLDLQQQGVPRDRSHRGARRRAGADPHRQPVDVEPSDPSARPSVLGHRLGRRALAKIAVSRPGGRRRFGSCGHRLAWRGKRVSLRARGNVLAGGRGREPHSRPRCRGRRRGARACP